MTLGIRCELQDFDGIKKGCTKINWRSKSYSFFVYITFKRIKGKENSSDIGVNVYIFLLCFMFF